MRITYDWLWQQEACISGLSWFKENFPDGGDYQEVLDTLGKENRSDYAFWLLEHINSETNYRIKLDKIEEKYLYRGGDVVCNGPINISNSIVIAGDLTVKGPIHCGWHMCVFGDVYGGEDLKCGMNLICRGSIIICDKIEGNSIHAGENIEATHIVTKNDLTCGKKLKADEIQSNRSIQARNILCPKIEAKYDIFATDSLACKQIQAQSICVGC
jgi:hypothetical protein